MRDVWGLNDESYKPLNKHKKPKIFNIHTLVRLIESKYLFYQRPTQELMQLVIKT